MKVKRPVGVRKYNKTQTRNYPSVSNMLEFLENKDRETLLRFVKEYECEQRKYG